MGSFKKRSKNPTTQTSTTKSVEEVDAKVMQTQKAIKLFQIMAIVSLNMGNLNLEASNVKNRLATWEKEKEVLQNELDKERDLQKGYKHNVEICKKNKEVEQNIKMFIKKLQDENEELKDNTTQLKSQDEKKKHLKQKVESWETTERKWTQALFFHKKQQEALSSKVKALTKEKKENKNVLTDLELMDMKNASLS